MRVEAVTGAMAWPELAAGQAGMLSQRQLNTLGVSRGFVRNQLRARRWSQRTSSVFSITTGPLTRAQLLWLATLHAGPTALVGGLTAAELHGLRGWHRDVVTVMVDDELSFEPLEGVRFFRSRRPLTKMRAPGAAPGVPDGAGRAVVRSLRLRPPHRMWRHHGLRTTAPDHHR